MLTGCVIYTCALLDTSIPVQSQIVTWNNLHRYVCHDISIYRPFAQEKKQRKETKILGVIYQKNKDIMCAIIIPRLKLHNEKNRFKCLTRKEESREAS